MSRELLARSTREAKVYKILCALLSPRNSLSDILGALDFLGATPGELHSYREVKDPTHGCELFVVLWSVSSTLAVC